MQAHDILQAANEARPDLISKTASAIAILEKLSPGHASDLAQEMGTIISYTSEKTAAADFRNFGMGVAGTLVAGLGTAVASDLYDAAKRGLTKGQNFSRIMEANPELHARFKADPKAMRMSFDTIHRYAPEFTADPILGGSLLLSAVESPSSSVAMIKDLVGARKSLREAKAKQYSAGHVQLERVDTRFQEQKELASDRAKHDLALAENRMHHDMGSARSREAHERNIEDIRHDYASARDIDKDARSVGLTGGTLNDLFRDSKKRR